MKILYIANLPLPTEIAQGVLIMKMCEAFALAGASVELVVPMRLNQIKQDPFKYYGVRENFKIKRLPTLDLVRFGKIGFWIQSLSFACFAFVLGISVKADIIYSCDEIPLWFLSFFKKNIVLEIHVTKKNFISKRVFKKVLRVIAITKGLRQFYIKEYGIDFNKIHWSPDAVDLDEFSAPHMTQKYLREKYGLPINKKIIGYVGKFKTMGKRKGVEELIKVFPKLLKSNKNVFLMLVGVELSEANEIQSIFNDLCIMGNTYKMINHVPREEVINYLRISDLLIMNYPNIEHYAHYMSPMKLFEYMASKKPIVASDLPSIREILNDNNSILINPDSERGLENGIIKLLNDDYLSNQISKQAFADVQCHTWQKRAEEILDFIKS